MVFDGGGFFRFLIAALATWRLAFLLARERGPWGIFVRLRHSARAGIAGGLLKCVKCVGIWVAIPFAFFVRGDWTELVCDLAGASRCDRADRRVYTPAVRVAGVQEDVATGDVDR